MEKNNDAHKELQRELAEDSLADFIRLGWKHMDPATYISNWHIDIICDHLEAVTRGDIRHLIINVPPRHMKSLSCAVAFPAWTWVQQPNPDKPLAGPHVRFLAASYAHSLSMRDNVKCRRLIQSPWYTDQWGDRFELTGDQNTKTRFENDQHGYRIATSVDGTATGEGGDIIIVDDALSAGDAGSPVARLAVTDWWDQTMSTRLNDPKTGAFVLIAQRLHQQDLIGHILDREAKDWTVLCLPARYEVNHPNVYIGDHRKQDGELLWPSRMGEAEIVKLEKSLGSYGAAGQLQQRPAPRDGGMFKRAWFEIVEAAPANLKTVRGWDLAGTVPAAGKNPDWTAGVKIGRCSQGFFWVTDVARIQGSAHQVETLMKNTASQDGKTVTVKLSQDPGQAGKAQVQAHTKMLAGYTVRSSPETGSKVQRAEPFEAQCEAGNVRIVRGSWNEAFLAELELFPFGAHDDQVDATSGAFSQLAGGSDARAWIDFLQSKTEALNESNRLTSLAS